MKRNGTPLFVFSACRGLRVQSDLLATLGLDEQYVRRVEHKRKLDDFLSEAQRVWSSVWQWVDDGKINFVLWLRQLVQESCQMGIWIPRPVILRLRQLERGELTMWSKAGRVELPPFAGLPEEFRECCEFMDWRFWHIVPGLRSGEYTDCAERGTDETSFVMAVCDAWKRRPANLQEHALATYITDAMDKAGWVIH
jgi:hypothetical protein